MWDELEEHPDILAELNDPNFATRTHGKRATHSKGCHGPLCRKQERDNTRERHARKQKSKGKIVVPRDPGPARERDEFLQRVIDWHHTMRKEPNAVLAQSA